MANTVTSVTVARKMGWFVARPVSVHWLAGTSVGLISFVQCRMLIGPQNISIFGSVIAKGTREKWHRLDAMGRLGCWHRGNGIDLGWRWWDSRRGWNLNDV